MRQAEVGPDLADVLWSGGCDALEELDLSHASVTQEALVVIGEYLAQQKGPSSTLRVLRSVKSDLSSPLGRQEGAGGDDTTLQAKSGSSLLLCVGTRGR